MSGGRKGDCCGDPWPQLITVCARVVEIYARIFDKPDLLKISKCLKSVCKNCSCNKRIKECVEEGVNKDVQRDGKEDVQKDVKENVKEDATEDVNKKIEEDCKEGVKHIKEIIIESIGEKFGNFDEEQIIDLNDENLFGYSFVPRGLSTIKEITRFYSGFQTDMIPKLGSKGDEIRKLLLSKQNPVQDEIADNCEFIEEFLRGDFEDFVKIRREYAFGKGMVQISTNEDKNCSKCKGTINPDSYFVTSSKMKDHFWHPNCFKCDDCDEFLQDLIHYVHEGASLLCGRHYGEKLRPRCWTCDELIFSQTCTRAMGKNWHTNHFWCKQCNVVLTGKKYAQNDGKPYCLQCYESFCANTCQKCLKTIAIDEKYLVYKKKHWHESCFTCRLCKESLVNKKFIVNNSDISCEKCHEEILAPRCQFCSKTFKPRAKSVEYKKKIYHEECFLCKSCKSPIGNKKFFNRNEEIFCERCHIEKFSPKCAKCQKSIIGDGAGLTYRNLPYHARCFTCTNCPKLLSGLTFTSRNENPYCVDCFGALFASKCFACREPISGENGTKYVNYDNHHWHDNCFFCSSCQCNLGGRRFVMEEDAILCPGCARSKFEEALYKHKDLQ